MILALAGLLILLVLNFAIGRRDVLYPGVLVCLVWVGTLIVSVGSPDLISPTPTVLLLIVGGMSLFTATCFLTMRSSSTQTIEPAPAPRWNVLLWIIFLVPIFGLPFFIHRAIELSVGGPFQNPLTNVRYSLSTLGASYGPLAYLTTVSSLSASILVSFRKLPLVRFSAALAVATTYAFLTTGRTSLTLLIVSILGVLLIQRRLQIARGLMLLAALVVIVFISVAVFHAKAGTRADLPLVENLLGLWSNLRLYIAGSTSALSVLVQETTTLDGGRHVFRTVLAVFQRLGAGISVPSLVQPVVPIPIPYNVYTVYGPYFRDFGLLGALAAQGVIGAWHGFLYGRAGPRSTTFSILYGLFLFPLLLQGFDDEYFTSLSLWLQYIGVLMVYAYLLRRHARARDSAKSEPGSPDSARAGPAGGQVAG